MPSRIPKRLQWAADVLAVRPDDHILEIGCGRGIAVELIGARLGEGRITGLDRSPAAITAAESRNRDLVRGGKARLWSAALADAPSDETFGKVFAVNVNVFWLSPARELAVIRRVLASGGRLYLFYEPPAAEQLTRIEEACCTFLTAAGFTVVDTLCTNLAPNAGLCIVAEPSVTPDAPAGHETGAPPTRR
jgi:SAM-dependent methyltransferase